MMNRYIAALLVVLATAGLEAQTYQSALKVAMADISYEEFIKQPQARAFEDDILAIIKAIKKAKQDLTPALQHKYHGNGSACPGRGRAAAVDALPVCFVAPHPLSAMLANGFHTCIVIRGPSACLLP